MWLLKSNSYDTTVCTEKLSFKAFIIPIWAESPVRVIALHEKNVTVFEDG